MTKAEPGPIVPPAHEGRRRNFTDADKGWIIEKATRPGASLSAVAQRYGIARRLLFRCKDLRQEVERQALIVPRDRDFRVHQLLEVKSRRLRPAQDGGLNVRGKERQPAEPALVCA